MNSKKITGNIILILDIVAYSSSLIAFINKNPEDIIMSQLYIILFLLGLFLTSIYLIINVLIKLDNIKEDMNDLHTVATTMKNKTDEQFTEFAKKINPHLPIPLEKIKYTEAEITLMKRLSEQSNKRNK